VMVQGKGEVKVLRGWCIYDEKQRTENGALGNATGRGIEGRESVTTSDTEGAITGTT